MNTSYTYKNLFISHQVKVLNLDLHINTSLITFREGVPTHTRFCDTCPAHWKNISLHLQKGGMAKHFAKRPQALRPQADRESHPGVILPRLHHEFLPLNLKCSKRHVFSVFSIFSPFLTLQLLPRLYSLLNFTTFTVFLNQ